MLSVVTNSPDSSCSLKIVDLDTDEKGHSPPSLRPSFSSEADPADSPAELQHPRFSIRDYVLSCRSKHDGENNWPFPQQYLQLCVKHGVRDFLPPFEPPNVVRSQLNGECEAAEELIEPSKVEGTRTEVPNPVTHGVDQLPFLESAQCSPIKPEKGSLEDKCLLVQAVTCKDEQITKDQTKSQASGHGRAESVLNSSVCQVSSVPETSTVSELSSVAETAKASSLREKNKSLLEPSVKKCRLIVRFGGIPDSQGTDQKSSGFSTLVSDPMASVCPVCKTFSSSSNTTLNAHIDQCLFTGSSVKGDAVNPSHHKVKPRKKRSMEEIYATAARFTLQDLDRRNGSNWELELTSKNCGASHLGEIRDTTVSLPRTTGGENGGAIYIDSKGTKLLILSKFNDACPTAAACCSGADKCVEKLKNKCSRIGKKKRFHAKSRKIQSKMDSSRHVQEEVYKNQKLSIDTHHEDKTIHNVSNAAKQMKVGNLGTLHHWTCAKRSRLLKHLNDECNHRSQRNNLAMGHRHHMPRKGRDHSSSCGHSPMDKPIQRSFESEDRTAFSLRRADKHVFSGFVFASGIDEQCPTDICEENGRLTGNVPSTSNETTARCSKFKGKHVSSVESTSLETCAYARTTTGMLPCLGETSVDYLSPMPKGIKCASRPLRMNESQCAIKCNEVIQGIVPRKPRRQRFKQKPRSGFGSSPEEIVDGLHDFCSSHDISPTSGCVKSGVPQLILSQNITRSDTSDWFDNIAPNQQERVDADKADGYHHASGREDVTLSNSQLGSEPCHAVKNFDAPVDPPSIDSLVKYPLVTMLDAFSNEHIDLENHKTSTCEMLESSSRLEHQPKLDDANKVINIPCPPKLQSNKGMYSDVFLQGIHMVSQNEFSANEARFSEPQNMEYQADHASTQGPSFHSLCPDDEVVGLQNRLSVNACRTTMPVEAQHLTVEKEPSGSPTSATSTISHLSENPKSKYGERESSEEPVVSHEQMTLDTTRFAYLEDDDVIRQVKTTGMENTTPEVQESENSDGQTCFCTQGKNFYCGSRFLRQNAMPELMPPRNIKQVTPSLYVNPIFSSSGPHSNSTSEVTIPILDPHTHCRPASSLPAFSRFNLSCPPSHVQSQNASSAILRLMGKNLMVMNEERPAKQRLQPVSTYSEGTSNGKYLSLPGFSSTPSLSNLDSTEYHSLEGQQLVGEQLSNFQVPISPAGQVGPYSNDNHWRLDKQPYSSSAYIWEEACMAHERKAFPVNQGPVLERDIVVIDDTSDYESEPCRSIQYPRSSIISPLYGSHVSRIGPPFCYSSRLMFQPVDPGSSLNPAPSIAYPRQGTIPTMWISTSVSSGPPLPRQYITPSTQLAMKMHCSSHFR